MSKTTLARGYRHLTCSGIILVLIIVGVLIGCVVWMLNGAPAIGQTAPTVYVFPSRPPQLAAELWDVHPLSPQCCNRFFTPCLVRSDDGKRCLQFGPTIDKVAEEYGDLGAGVDHGTVRAWPDGRLEVAAPSGAGGSGRWWPVDASKLFAIRAQARYGPGWGYDGSLDPHAMYRHHYPELTARDPVRWPPRASMSGRPRRPGDCPVEDISYDAGQFRVAKRGYDNLLRGEDPGDGPACTGGSAPPPQPTPTAAPTPTATPGPTPTPTPAATPSRCPPGCVDQGGFCECGQPTPTPRPTATPRPTPTPAPTATPQPTATPPAVVPTPPPPRCPTSRVTFTDSCRSATAQVAAGKPLGPKRLAGLRECKAAHDKLPADGGVFVPGEASSGRLSLTLGACQ